MVAEDIVVMTGIPGWNRFDEIARDYDNNFLLTRRPAQRLVEFAAVKPRMRVLEVGCGTGFATFQIARDLLPGGLLLATDLSAEMVKVAQANANRKSVSNVQFKVMDGAQLNLTDNEFDLLICCHALFGFPDIGKALKEWKRVLKPGGVLAFSSISIRRKHLVERKEVAEVFSRYFEKELNQRMKDRPLSTPEDIAVRLDTIGLETIDIREENLAYRYQTFNEFWNAMTSSPFKLRLNLLEEEQILLLRNDLEDLLGEEFAQEGYLETNPTILTKARKPEGSGMT